MTLGSEVVKLQFAGDGATIVFAITFEFWDVDEFEVVLSNDTTGAETPWVRGTQYTLAKDDPTKAKDTGNLTVITTPTDHTPLTGETLTVKSDVPDTQLTSLPAGGPLPSASVEQEFDKTVRRIQQDTETIGRALVFPLSDPPTAIDDLPGFNARASQFLGFDAGGKPIAAAGTSADLGPVSAYINTLLDDADAATARATLGAAGDIDDNVFTGKSTFTGEFVLTKGADIASATTIVIPAAGNYFDVTGTTPITGMTVDTERFFILQFDAALIFTHGASLLLQGKANIVTAAGDRAICYAEAADTVRVLDYVYADGGQVGAITGRDGSTLTIATGSVTPTGSYHAVDTESAASADELDTVVLSSIPEGGIIILRAVNAAHVVTVRDGVDNIILGDGGNYVLNDTSKTLVLQKRGANAEEIARSEVGGLASVQVFTANGTWTKPSGITKVIAEGVGAGGNGSASGVAGPGGNGGGGGGYCKEFIDVIAIASVSVTVGTAAGASSTFGSHWTAGGGGNGSTSAVGTGGTATGGNINIPGQDGGERSTLNAGAPGGDSVLGFGGGAREELVQAVGRAGKVYGGGGGGGGSDGSGASQAGGGDATGIVIVWEYR